VNVISQGVWLAVPPDAIDLANNTAVHLVTESGQMPDFLQELFPKVDHLHRFLKWRSLLAIHAVSEALGRDGPFAGKLPEGESAAILEVVSSPEFVNLMTPLDRQVLDRPLWCKLWDYMVASVAGSPGRLKEGVRIQKLVAIDLGLTDPEAMASRARHHGGPADSVPAASCGADEVEDEAVSLPTMYYFVDVAAIARLQPCIPTAQMDKLPTYTVPTHCLSVPFLANLCGFLQMSLLTQFFSSENMCVMSHVGTVFEKTRPVFMWFGDTVVPPNFQMPFAGRVSYVADTMYCIPLCVVECRSAENDGEEDVNLKVPLFLNGERYASPASECLVLPWALCATGVDDEVTLDFCSETVEIKLPESLTKHFCPHEPDEPGDGPGDEERKETETPVPTVALGGEGAAVKSAPWEKTSDSNLAILLPSLKPLPSIVSKSNVRLVRAPQPFDMKAKAKAKASGKAQANGKAAPATWSWAEFFGTTGFMANREREALGADKQDDEDENKGSRDKPKSKATSKSIAHLLK
jgi:hypothetical protein